MVKSVGVFVNSSLLFYVVQAQYKRSNPQAKIDYTAYLNHAVGDDGKLYRAFAYGAQIDNEAAGFIECLQRTGFETRYVPAKCVNGKHHVLDTDRNIEMAVDVIRIAHRLDVVVLGSNDPDLIPLVKFIKEKGTKVVIFAARIPRELARAADEVREITESILELKDVHPANT